MEEQKRYTLKRNPDVEMGWVLTDTEKRIQIKFENGKFNETQQTTLLPDASMEMTAKEITDAVVDAAQWLTFHHYFTAMPFSREQSRALYAHRLRRMRQEAGLSVYALAKRTSVASNNIIRLEKGEYGGMMETYEELFAAMGHTFFLYPEE